MEKSKTDSGMRGLLQQLTHEGLVHHPLDHRLHMVLLHSRIRQQAHLGQALT